MADQFLIAQIRPKYKLSPKMQATMDGDIDIDFPLTMRLTKAIWLSLLIDFH